MTRFRSKTAGSQFVWYEFFAGGGMARLGLGGGWRCALANEWCPKKAMSYRAHFGRSPELKVEDVANLSTADMPEKADLVWASFPCQDLSLAGNGAGLNGHRSGTFWPFWRLMEGLVAEGRSSLGERSRRDYLARRQGLRRHPRWSGRLRLSVRPVGNGCRPLPAALAPEAVCRCCQIGRAHV